MQIIFNKSLQDGKLTKTAGRIVIYKEYLEISRGPSRDHLDLLNALARKFRLPRDPVISNAIRLYWDRVNTAADKNVIVVCPVRKLDEDMYFANEEFHKNIILKSYKM